MTTTFPTPPTFASPVIVNGQTGQNQFNPIWLNWFLVLANYLSASGSGRLRDITPVTSSGVYTPSSGTNNIITCLWGSGGTGGGAAVTAAGQIAVGGGGGAGAFAFAVMTSGFAGATLTIGTLGAATTFNGLVAGGGSHGGAGTAVTPPIFTLGGNGGLASGSALFAGAGSAGLAATAINVGTVMSGQGADATFGQGGLPVTVTGNGNNGIGFGSGGSGALNLASSATAQAGGLGAPGCAFIMELS